ncbi:MAG TPA: rhamnulokinase family protein [Anaerolineales bacterium]|jgi:rhamnulokinase
MPTAHNFLAIDIGAESGRAIIGSLQDRQLTLTETYRFTNGPVQLSDGLHWDVLRIWSDIKEGIGRSTRIENRLDGIGLDTWAVDFALLDEKGGLLGDPFHYRDSRTDGRMEEAFKSMSRAEIFANSGVQFMQLNTLYQLIALRENNPSMLDAAKTFVTIPDLFNYWLCGEITNEFTNATTTQCFDPRKRDWSTAILDAFKIPRHLFRPVTEPGTRVGRLLADIAEEIHADAIPVIVPACHDTGSAVVAVPASAADFVWISSGTWSIMGVETELPVINEKALEYNFTNEGGACGTWRFSKNIMGLWLIQECRREWMRHGEVVSYDTLIQMASDSEPFLSVIDPDFAEFLHSGDMPARIQKFCADTNQPVPQSKGQIVRIVLEGIALKYRWVLEKLEELTRKHFGTIHIIGGGTQNRLLNQFAANATRRMVITGPVEATAIGNILMQAIGLKQLRSLAEAREVVRASFEGEIIEPDRSAGWDDAYARLVELMKIVLARQA